MLKSLKENELEKCSKCSRWISLDEYILNHSKCEDCKNGLNKPENN